MAETIVVAPLTNTLLREKLWGSRNHTSTFTHYLLSRKTFNLDQCSSTFMTPRNLIPSFVNVMEPHLIQIKETSKTNDIVVIIFIFCPKQHNRKSKLNSSRKNEQLLKTIYIKTSTVKFIATKPNLK